MTPNDDARCDRARRRSGILQRDGIPLLRGGSFDDSEGWTMRGR